MGTASYVLGELVCISKMTSVCDFKKANISKGDRHHIKVVNHMLETSLPLEFYLKFNLENFLDYLKNVFL